MMPSRETRAEPPTLLSYVRDADVVFVNHLPALPASEEENDDHDEGNPNARPAGACRAAAIALVEIHEL